MNRYNLAIAGAGAINTASASISGVSVITEGDAIGHGVMIDGISLATVKTCAEEYAGGLKVKMNHGSGADSICGVLRNFRIDGNQLRADLQLLKNHRDTPLILEMAETIAESFGLSISFSGSVEEIGESMFVRCLEIYSCDIVDQPAANPNGLFSVPSVDTSAQAMASTTATISLDVQNLETVKAQIIELTSERDAAREQAKKNFADFTALNEKHTALLATVDGINAQLSAATETNDKLTLELAEARKTSAEAVNAEAARALAATGHAPIAAEIKAQPAAETPKPKLTGLARTRAAFAAQIRKQQPTHSQLKHTYGLRIPHHA